MQNAPNTVLSGPSNSLRTNTAVRSVVDKPPAVPLRSSLKQTKMTRFSDKPTVHRIPPRSRARRNKYTNGGMYDPSYEAEIIIEPPSSKELTAQDQNIEQESAETESQNSAIDTEDTPGEPPSNAMVAPQVDIVSLSPLLAMVNGHSEPSNPPMEVTSLPRIPRAAVDTSTNQGIHHPLMDDNPLMEEALPPMDVPPPETPASGPASATTSRSTSPTAPSTTSDGTDSCTSELSLKQLRTAEKDVLRALRTLERQQGHKGVLPHGRFTELCVHHAWKGMSIIETQKVPPVLQPATAEPRRVKTPKPVLKRSRLKPSTDSDDPDMDPTYKPRERKRSKVQDLINRSQSSEDEDHSPPRPRGRHHSKRIRRPSEQCT